MLGAYNDPLDVVMAINLFQQRWDQTETSGIANVVLAGTATGVPPKQLLLHMAIGDDEVPNLATEWQARSMGIPVLAPASPYVPWGLTMATGPIAGGSALVIMDGGAPPVPLTNEPAPETGMQIRRRPGQVLPYAMTVAGEWNPPHRVRHVAIEAWKKPEAVFSWQGIDTGVGHRYRSRLTAQCLTFEHRHRESAVHEFVRGG